MGLSSLAFPEPDRARESRTERQKRRILDAAARVLVTDRGASMQKIAEAAGVGRTTVHRHFPGREALIRAIAISAIAEAEAAIDRSRLSEGPVDEAVGRLAEVLVPMGHRFHFLLSEGQIEDDPEILAASQWVIKPLEALIERGRCEGVFRLDVPPAWIVDVMVSIVYAAWDAVRCGRVAPLDAPRLVATTVLDGVSGIAGEGSVR